MSRTFSRAKTLLQQFAEMQEFVRMSAKNGQAIHEVERGLWQRLRQMGHECLEQFLRLQGTGDMGETVTLPTAKNVTDFRSCTSAVTCPSSASFTCRGPSTALAKDRNIEFVPLDNRLQLPESVFSYVLQDWDQSLCVEEAFRQAKATMWRILGLNQSVDSLEHMNQEMAQDATRFMLNRPAPARRRGDRRGQRRRQRDRDAAAGRRIQAPKAHRTKGDKASQKRMATVATVYTVDRYRRTPEEVVAALFRDAPERSADRPRPQHKEVWASLPRDDQPGSGIGGGVRLADRRIVPAWAGRRQTAGVPQ